MKKALKISAGFLFGAAFVFAGCSSFKKMFTGYSATIEDGIENGTVTADKTEGIAKESTVTLSFAPAEGYEWDTVSVKAGEKEEEVAVSANTFIMPSDDVKISATFKKCVPTKSKPESVGDLVLNDGTAVSFENISEMPAGQKAKAVAVIFYVGDECSNNGENRVLGVGLVHEMAQWQKEKVTTNVSSGSGFLNAAKSFAVETAKEISSDSSSSNPTACYIQVDTVGNVVGEASKKAFSATNMSKVQYVIDSYIFKGDKNGSDNFAQLSAFLKSSGKDNTAPVSLSGEDLRKGEPTLSKLKIFEGQNYPAFYFAKNYKDYKLDYTTMEPGLFTSKTVRVYKHTNVGKYESGWYLPSIVELFQIWKNKDIVNKAVSACGGDEFGEDSSFLSSSQYTNMIIDGVESKVTKGENCIFNLRFSNGGCSHDYKDNTGAVCAIREF